MNISCVLVLTRIRRVARWAARKKKTLKSFSTLGTLKIFLSHSLPFFPLTTRLGLVVWKKKKTELLVKKNCARFFFFCSSQSLFFCGKEERNKKWTFIKNAVAADYVNICGKVVVMFALHHHHRFVFRGYWKNSQLSTCQHLKSALNLHRAAIFIKCKMMK